MSPEQAKNGSVLHGISINAKDKLMWNGSYEELQMFVEEVLDISDGIWDCPGGDSKRHTSSNLVMRWYQDTRSITLNGDRKDEIKEKLISLALVAKQVKNPPHDGGVADDQYSQVDANQNQTDAYQLSLETIKNQLEALTINVNENKNAIKSFSNKMTKDLDQTKVRELEKQLDFLKEENDKLKNENLCLKSENKDLTERTNNLSYILADLQGKAKNAELERDSLITAARLLVLESSQDDKKVPINMQNCDNQIELNEADDCTQLRDHALNSNIQLKNRFSAFNDEAKQPDQTTTVRSAHEDHKLGKKKKKSKPKDGKRTNESIKRLSDDQIQTQQEDQQQSKTKTSVVVAGDSMIKYVKGWELSTGQQNVSVKPFSGATVDDMSDFLKPTLRKHPDKLIIHVGTNDIRKSDPKIVADKVTILAKQFKKDSSNTEVVISSLVVRNDGPELAKKVQQTNILLKSNCISHDLGFLDNSNIDCSHLNYRGLHLNRDGSALLQNNIANILKAKD